MPADEFQGVILAAGSGSRLEPFSNYWPKVMLPVCNKPILQYQIEFMRDIGITDITIVVGYLKEKVIDYFGDGSKFGIRTRFVEQKERLGIAHAVGQLEEHIKEPFLLFLGDIFFLPKNLGSMLETFNAKGCASVLAVKKESNPEYIRRNFAVILDDDGRVHRVIEKPRYLANNLKGCGMYLFGQEIFDAIRRTPRTAMRDEYEITNSIQILIEDDYPVYAAEVVDWDINVTFAEDILTCTKAWLQHIKEDSVIDESCQLHPECKVSGSAIGANATISNPIRIENSVIFPETNVDAEDDIVDMIVSSHAIAGLRTPRET